MGYDFADAFGVKLKQASPWRKRRANWMQCFLFRLSELAPGHNLQEAIEWVTPRLPDTVEAIDAIFTPANVEREVKLCIQYLKAA